MKPHKKICTLFLAGSLAISGCATGRDMTSKHYLPEWENKIVNVPSPSETSGGYWAAKTARGIAYGTGKVLLVPFALIGNLAVNSYLIVTWPLRWAIRGDKRLIVWMPLFHVGDDVGSSYYSKEWNRDLV